MSARSLAFASQHEVAIKMTDRATELGELKWVAVVRVSGQHAWRVNASIRFRLSGVHQSSRCPRKYAAAASPFTRRPKFLERSGWHPVLAVVLALSVRCANLRPASREEKPAWENCSVRHWRSRARPARASMRSIEKRPAARDANSINTQRSWCSGKVRKEPKSFSLASSRATGRMLPDSRFVGPAGKLLDRCLEEAGIERDACYVTNAVKHFKFELRGKRRIHAKPNRGEVQLRAWWLAAELRLVRPKLVVALGATAAYSLLGTQVKVTRDRGSVFRSPVGLSVFVTIHPSALLRVLDQPAGRQELARFVNDLKAIVTFVEDA